VTFQILGISPSELMNSYFSEGLKPQTRNDWKQSHLGSFHSSWPFLAGPQWTPLGWGMGMMKAPLVPDFFLYFFRFQDSSRMGRFSETGITKSILPLPHLIQWLTWMTSNDAEWSTDPSWFLWCCSNTISMCDRWKLRWVITCSIVFKPRRRRRWCLALGPCISPLGYGLLIVLVDGWPSSQRFCWHNQRSIGTWMNMASIKLTHCFSMKGHEAGSHLSIACASEFQTVDGKFGNLRTHLWLSQMPNIQISKSKISK
jgi:hypothetical protein